MRRGLMNGPGVAGAPMDPGGGKSAPEGQAPDGEAGNVTPEEQAQYDEFVDKGFQLIYVDNALQAIMERVSAAETPVEGLATVIAQVVRRLKSSAIEQGVELSEAVMFHGGVELLEDLAETLTKAGVHSFTEEETEGALYRALDIYREQAMEDGTLDNEAIGQDMALIQQADREGRIEEVLPGIGKAAERMQGRQQQDPMEDEDDPNGGPGPMPPKRRGLLSGQQQGRA